MLNFLKHLYPINSFYCHIHQPTCVSVASHMYRFLIKPWYTTNSFDSIGIILIFNCFHIFLLYYLPDRFHLQWFRYGYLRRFITAIQNPSSVYRYWQEWHFTIRPPRHRNFRHRLSIILKMRILQPTRISLHLQWCLFIQIHKHERPLCSCVHLRNI